MGDMVATMAVVTTEDTDILTMEDMDTTVERDLLMPNQKQKLPLIQVPGMDMVLLWPWLLRRIRISIQRILRQRLLLGLTQDHYLTCITIAGYPTLPFQLRKIVF